MNRLRKLAPPAIGLFVLGTLLLTTACGSSNADARLLNAIPGVSSVDLVLNNKTLASGIAYGTASSYASVSPGSPSLQVVDASGNALTNQTISLSTGSYSTILATASGTLVFTDNRSAPSSGNIEIRVINASPTLGTADVYVVTSGTDITTVNPTASNVTFQSSIAYQTLSAGSYEAIFTQPGQKYAVIDSSPLSFSSGQIRTVVGLDGLNGGFTTAVLSDLN